MNRSYLAGLFTFLFILILAFGFCFASENKTFTVALTGKYPPFNFYDNQGKLAGFDVDVSKGIAKRLDRKLEIITTEWDGILAGLLTDKYDVIIGSMAITPERKKAVDFSIPYYVSGAQLFVKRDNMDEIKNIDSCTGKRIGVGLGETYEHYLRQNYPDIIVVPYKSSVDIFEDMNTGRLSGFVTDRLVGSWQIKNAGKNFVPVGDFLYKEEMAIPVKKNRKDLLRLINSALMDMEKSGELAGLHKKWFGTPVEKKFTKSAISTPVIIRMLLKGFAITLVVAVASILIGFFLAIPCGIILNRGKGFLYIIFRAFVDFIRGTPVLIQLFFVYFGAPQVGIILSPIASAILTLSINSMAYMSEVVRSGLMSVDRGQTLAGRALGFSRFQIFRLLVWPRA
ncbi:MAG: ABC transporter substrate-binding protein/permease, partial [Candidatus Eremiobacteraeota bacterium]|nr:ABC transporter substrate-binding protein/permease [Candidatus Eremiobacteraeota bacterium]